MVATRRAQTAIRRLCGRRSAALSSAARLTEARLTGARPGVSCGRRRRHRRHRRRRRPRGVLVGVEAAHRRGRVHAARRAEEAPAHPPTERAAQRSRARRAARGATVAISRCAMRPALSSAAAKGCALVPRPPWPACASRAAPSPPAARATPRLCGSVCASDTVLGSLRRPRRTRRPRRRCRRRPGRRLGLGLDWRLRQRGAASGSTPRLTVCHRKASAAGRRRAARNA